MKQMSLHAAALYIKKYEELNISGKCRLLCIKVQETAD
jgi:hypothetical protein